MNLWKNLFCAAALAVASLPAAAAADAPEPRPTESRAAKRPVRAKRPAAAKPRAAKPTRAQQPRVKHYDFLGDELKGELVAPDGVDLQVRGTAQHTNLIRVRADFVREIGKAAEDL